ncbi:MAG: hypothetical protein QNJ13_11000 [Paracoccaceae bacterium]|nr:hypothetical protein [Paracoccaceae bacterium]
MIVANLATYPPRRDRLAAAIDRIAPQVDRLNIVLNEYGSVPQEVSGHRLAAKVAPILPPKDTKDTGKFFPEVDPGDTVFLVDDDIDYPADFVARTKAALDALGPGHMAGYHGSLYIRPAVKFSMDGLRRWARFLIKRRAIARFRKVYWCVEALERAVVVDQIATNACVLRGADMPPFSFMESSQRFVDVRLARWCHEKGIRPVCLPREAGWLTEIAFDESIYQGFTRTDPAHVAREIRSYAFRVAGRGQTPRMAKT